MHLDITEMNWPSRCCGLESYKKQSNQVQISCLPIKTPVRHWYASLPWIIITEEKLCDLRDGPLENLWQGGRRSRKNYSRKEKLNEKNLCMPINPKKNPC